MADCRTEKTEIAAVFLDIDNTLLDFDASVRETMKSGFALYGLQPYEEWMFSVFLEISGAMWREIENGTRTYESLLEQRWNRIFTVLGVDFDGRVFEQYFEDCLSDSAIPVEGAAELLENLQDRCIVCAASNGPYEQQVNRLTRSRMLPCFRHLFISQQLGASKPSKEFFDRCMEVLNEEQRRLEMSQIAPSQIVMIGDSLTSDMAGGIGSGLKTCYFDRTGNGDSRGLPVDGIVSCLSEIPVFLSELEEAARSGPVSPLHTGPKERKLRN